MADTPIVQYEHSDGNTLDLFGTCRLSSRFPQRTVTHSDAGHKTKCPDRYYLIVTVNVPDMTGKDYATLKGYAHSSPVWGAYPRLTKINLDIIADPDVTIDDLKVVIVEPLVADHVIDNLWNVTVTFEERDD